MRVLCLVPYPTLGASNRLRVEQYRAHLRADGIELVVSPFLDDATYAVLYRYGHTLRKALGVVRGLARRARDVLRASSFDLVLVHREATPIGPPVVERVLARRRIPYVFDFDDAIFLPSVHPANRRWAWLRHPSRVRESVRQAIAVIAGNAYLAEWARDYNPNVTVIPTPVDTDRHRPREGPRPEGPAVIGWVGSSTTAPYLRILDEPLARIAARHDVTVRIVGGDYAHERARVELLPYRLESEADDIATFDVGVLPEPDDQWTRGKGALKGLLYMATAVPVVASRVGVNPEVILEDRTGYCVDGPEEWVDRLEHLIREPELRRRLGAAGRRHVEERYSVRSQAPRLARVLQSAAAAGR